MYFLNWGKYSSSVSIKLRNNVWTLLLEPALLEVTVPTWTNISSILYTGMCSLYDHVTPYSDVIMSAMASQITSVTIVYSAICSGADERKYQSSALLAFVGGIHRWPVNTLHKWPVTRKMFPFDDVIMEWALMSTRTRVIFIFLCSSRLVWI